MNWITEELPHYWSGRRQFGWWAGDALTDRGVGIDERPKRKWSNRCGKNKIGGFREDKKAA
jgi:hypothetical protein